MVEKISNTKKCRTFWVTYYWLKIAGINPLSLKQNNQLEFSYLSLVYGCFLPLPYLYVSYVIVVERLHMLLPGETPLGVIVDFMTLFVNFIEITSTWLSFGFYQNRLKCIVRSFIRAEVVSTQLKIPENYQKHFGELGMKQTVVTGFYFLWCITNSVMTIKHQNVYVLPWVSFFMSRLPAYNAVTLFIWSLNLVKHKFRRLNDKLRFLLRNDSARTIEFDKLNKISQLHRELRDVIYNIQRQSALFLFLNILSQFFCITLNVHIVYRLVSQQGGLKETDIVYLFSVSCWFIFPLIVLILISNVTGSTIKEANKTGNILHAMVGRCEEVGYIRKTMVVSLDLLHNRVRFSLLGFFDLDSSLVYNTIETATMYLMIMLQFYG